MRKYLFGLMLCVPALVVISCSSAPSSAGNNMTDSLSGTASITTEMIDTIPREAGVEVGGALMVPSRNIVQNMLRSKDHTTWIAVLQAAGLERTLQEAGPFTVFAPTNEAFNEMPAGRVDSLLLPGRKKELSAMLAYHMLRGAYRPADMKDGMELTTMEGRKLKIKYRNGTWWINDARVIISDVISSNGIIYITDAVLPYR